MRRIAGLLVLIFTLAAAAAFGTAMADTLVLPADTITIGEEAFYGVDAETIVLPEGVMTIGDRAFGGSNTLKTVAVPDSLMDREEAALGRRPDEPVFVRLSDYWNTQYNYTTIGDGVRITSYKGTDQEVVIPARIGNKQVTEIGSGAFMGNDTITKVDIPEGVTTLQNDAFNGCGNLTDVSFPTTLTAIGNNAFTECGNESGQAYYFRLPDNLTAIGRLMSDTQMAFYHCNAVRIVTPDSATARLLSSKNAEMCWFTFPGEEDFSYLYYKDQNDTDYNHLCLKKYKGYGTEVVIPDHGAAYTRISRIEDSSFEGREDITSVVIPEGVTYIGNAAFRNCYLLTNVTFPSTLTQLGYNVFSECGKNADEPFYYYLPDHLTVMGKMDSESQFAFGYCKAIKVVNPLSDTALTLSRLGKRGWFSLPGKLDYLYQYYQSIDGGAYDRLRLTEYIGTHISANIPEGVDAIGSSAFANMASLTKVVIPEGVTVIESQAFANCYRLTDVSFPDSLRSIEAYAFGNCGRDAGVVFYYLLTDHITSIPRDANDPFKDCNARLCCTDGSITWEQLGDRWWGAPRSNWLIRYETIDDVTYVILGAYYGPFGTAGSVALEIPADLNVTNLGDDLFNGRYDLASVVIPDTVRTIGARAFKNCTYLNDIIFPMGLRYIEENAFTGCGSGTYIFRLPSGVQEIAHTGTAPDGGLGTGSFDGCEAILFTQPGLIGPDYTDTPHALEAAGYTYVTSLP